MIDGRARASARIASPGPSSRPWTLYVLHHSHTDIGYTELQSRITRWHVDFIRQALDIIDTTRDRVGEHFSGFRWVCETFWAVEHFLASASPDEKERFWSAASAGRIGLSASYVNFNELIDFELLERMSRRAREVAGPRAGPIDSAMTADINGYGWGFCRALVENGVQNLFSCVHTHHGMYPLGKTQVPFWWEAPDGKRVLVWSGEHYHFGNELGVMPGAVSSYLTKDECDADMIFSDHWGVAEIRIPRYVERLKREGYPFDFVPVMASGLRTDNGPPNPAIIDFIERWNEAHGHAIRVEMTTLGPFFERVRESGVDIPVHRGDWPDWWSDGPAGNPDHVRLFRQAQRERSYLNALRRHSLVMHQGSLDGVDENLALFAEHTFSHADAMSRPWHALVHAISARKKAYAAHALDQVRHATDELLSALCATSLRPDMPLRFRVINPLLDPVNGVARLLVGHFEYHERKLDRGGSVRDPVDDRVHECEVVQVPTGAEFCVPLRLGPGEERDLVLEPVPKEESVTPAPTVSGGGLGEASSTAMVAGTIETEFVRVGWRPDDGITTWHAHDLDRDLLQADAAHAPFTVVREITPVGGEPARDPDGFRSRVMASRGAMGLNRKGEDVRRHAARLVSVSGPTMGHAFGTAILSYKVPGVPFCQVELTAHRRQPRVDVTLRLHKTSEWEAENVYVALPFVPGDGSGQLWLDKTGAAVRPWVDQIPGTLTDYYAIQEGFAWVGSDMGVAVATPDSHLLQVGPLDPGLRLLAGDERLRDMQPHPYAWLMTNYWETNFEASLGGFHEFRFSVIWGRELADHTRALRTCRHLNHGLLTIRLRDESEPGDPG